MEVVTIPIIVMICSLVAQVIKLFTNGTDREEQILLTLVPISGAIIAFVLSYVHTDFILEFESPLVALTIGFISGQSALETSNVVNKIKVNNALKKTTTTQTETIIDSGVVTEVITEEIIEEN